MNVDTDITNPAGCCFVSYKRSRRPEVEMLIRCLNERGVPTWHDMKNLDETHTNSELRRVLQDLDTANAVLWITPDVVDSDIIRRVEAPLIMNRADSEDDSFFVIPVAAGGANYSEAAEAVGEDLSLTTLEEWNIRKIDTDPATENDVRAISKRVLSRRLRAVVAGLEPGEPIRLGLFARKEPATDNNLSLPMNWTGRITHRHASESIWNQHLLPAVDDVVDAVEQYGSGRNIVASGLPTISAAFALGRALMAPRGIESSWLQFSPTTGEVSWNLCEERENVDLAIRSRDKDAGGDELAVLVSVSAPVEHAWAASKKDLPSFRALLDVRLSLAGSTVFNAGQALDIAHQTIDAVRRARAKFRPKGAIHLFMSVPVGISFLLGQLCNTLGPIRLYEHDETDAVGRYVAGPLLRTGKQDKSE